MPTITYKFKRRRKRGFLNAVTFALLGMTFLVVLVSRTLGTDAPWTDALAEDLPFILAMLLMLLACVILVASILRPGGARREFLRLDEEGLTFGNLFGAHRWPWHDLSAFALRRQSGLNAFITFVFPGKSGRWTVNQFLLESTAKRRTAMIEDIYETPLEEIAAKLNAYRDRALGAGVE